MPSPPSSSWILGTDPGPITGVTEQTEVPQPVDILLDATGDLDIDSDIHFSTGLAAVAQGIRLRCLLFKGEWFLDLELGVPYFQDILGQKFSEVKVRTAFRNAILDTPGVAEIVSLTTDFNAATRRLTVSWVVDTDFGQVDDELEV